jgi:hypothetical protein
MTSIFFREVSRRSLLKGETERTTDWDWVGKLLDDGAYTVGNSYTSLSINVLTSDINRKHPPISL